MMKNPKLIFKVNRGRDLHNVWQTCNEDSSWHDFSKYMPSKVIEICKDVEFKKVKGKIGGFYETIHNSGLIEIYLKAVEAGWRKIEKSYFDWLFKLTGKEFDISRCFVYPTVACRCPYFYDNDKKKNSFFLINFFSSVSGTLGTIAHELMHFHFFANYMGMVIEKIGREKAEDLKEALTVLLREGAVGLYWSVDQGYEPHKKLRSYITKQWKKKKDFDLLIDKCIKYIERKS
ncbi:hypothetical protein HN935_00980 [archaeon]|jgi:hypothetical protein|nr:hypothetical protein [archaeon]